jgi:hypothetical protein
LPERLTLDATNDTIEKFRTVWRDSIDLPIAPKIRSSIDQHLNRIPVWRDFNRNSRP